MKEPTENPGLILARLEGETIVIRVPGYDPIYLSVDEISRGRCKLRFVAGKCVEINRLEVDNVRHPAKRERVIPKPSADPFLPKSLDAIAAGAEPEVSGRTE